MQAKEVFTLDDAVEVLLDQVIDNPKAYEDNWKQLNKIERMLRAFKENLVNEAVEAGKLIKHPRQEEVKAFIRNTHTKEWIK